MGALEGKVAVITGGNSGIGLATAKRFVEEGAYVFITARREAELNMAVSLIGKNVATIPGDLSNLEDIDRIAATVKAGKGVVDIVVSNAGLTEQGSIDSLTPAHFDKVFNLNAKAPVFLVQKLLPLMTGAGSIILVGSAMHVKGIPGHTAYAGPCKPQ
jgi:NAD(P)-dependent dehydrogenase (short-subunit alcohol dehydrogenase family)